jgi:selenocysteine lyase/cysteine desulfurase
VVEASPLAPLHHELAAAAGYLDTATYGLPPKATVEALRGAVRGWQQWQDWAVWEDDGEACRELFARIIGTEPRNVAIVPSVSVAAGAVAASLAAGPGDNVVCYEHEFQSALLPWLPLRRRGVEVRLVPLEQLADAVDERTALVAVSAVQSADGRVADLHALRATGARIFVDGTQAVGAFSLDLECADYLAVAAYKWLLCPRGLGFLYVAPDRLEEIEPWLAGWKGIDEVYETYYGEPQGLAGSARRLDSSLAWFLAAAARPSLELIDVLGVEAIAAHDLALAGRFCAGLGIEPTGSAIVQLRVADSDAAVERLRRADVKCAARAGALRFAFHLYNGDADVDRALEALGA